MAAGTLSITETFQAITCAECAMTFCVPTRFEADRRQDHKTFYCPAGHTQAYNAETMEEKLRRDRDRLAQQIARAEDETREARVERDKAVAAKKRIERRVGAGTCPCCSRSFDNLRAHMAGQHPEMAPRSAAKRAPPKRLMLPAPRS